MIHIVPPLHDTSIKRQGSLLWAAVGGPIQPAKQQSFTSAFSKEVRRHMTRASWCELRCLFKVRSACCRLVRGGQFYRRVSTVDVSHVSAGSRLPFKETETGHSVLIAQQRWRRPRRAWKLPDGSYACTGKNFGTKLFVIFLVTWKQECVTLECEHFSLVQIINPLTLAYQFNCLPMCLLHLQCECLKPKVKCLFLRKQCFSQALSTRPLVCLRATHSFTLGVTMTEVYY